MLSARSIRLRANAHRLWLGLALVAALYLAAFLARSLVAPGDHNNTAKKTDTAIVELETPETRAEKERCERVRRRVATSLVAYLKHHYPHDEELHALATPLFREKRLVVWSTQANAGPLLDLRALLEPLGVDFIEHTVQHNCRQLCDCNAPTRAIEAITARLFRPNDPFDPKQVTAFRAALANFQNFSRIDAFFSAYPFALFEYYLPFNRSVIAIAHMRMEMAREELLHWNELNANVRALSGRPEHVLGAASAYDRAYIAHFTGVNVDLVPKLGLHTGVSYAPTADAASPSAKAFLLADTPKGWFRELLEKELAKRQNQLVRLEAAFPAGYTYEHVASHRALIYLPTSTTSLRFIETYTMCVPMFVPSTELLLQWHEEHYLLKDRTNQGHFNDRRPGGSLQGVDPTHEKEADPNNDWDLKALRVWLQHADFTKLPYLMPFDSVAHLVDQLEGSTQDSLKLASANMCAYNKEAIRQTLGYWRRRLADIARHSPNRPH